MQARKKICGVYRFTHRKTEMSYIGSSHDIEKRKLDHTYGVKNKNPNKLTFFHKEILRLGARSFKFEIIRECEPEKRLELEKFYIEHYNTIWPYGFNIQKNPGGMRFVWTPEMRMKISISKMGKKMSPEACAKMSATKKKLCATKKWKKMASDLLKGRKMSAEWRRKISESGKGRVVTQETRNKIAAGLRGSKRPDKAAYWAGKRRLKSL